MIDSAELLMAASLLGELSLCVLRLLSSDFGGCIGVASWRFGCLGDWLPPAENLSGEVRLGLICAIEL